ncbi:MAG: flagellar biosynthetic protein FliP, partial [Janthinobacterium sp.]
MVLSNIKTPLTCLLAMAALALPLWALAQPGIPAFTSTPAPGGGQNYSLPVQTLILM